MTTGDSYTVAIAVEAIYKAAEHMNIDITQATVAVVGATGAIGKACSQLLSLDVGKLITIGLRPDATEAVRDMCTGNHAEVIASTELKDMYDADLILTVTSAIGAVIEPEHLKPGAVILDVARPRDVSMRVAQERDDVLVIEGGMVEVPGRNPDFHFDFGFPERKVFACMAETMMLALDGRYEDYTIGRDIELSRIQEIKGIASRHGFKLAGLRSFEHAVTQEKIDAVREQAIISRKTWSPALL